MCKSLKDVYEKQQSEAAKHKKQEEKSMYPSRAYAVLSRVTGRLGVTDSTYRGAVPPWGGNQLWDTHRTQSSETTWHSNNVVTPSLTCPGVVGVFTGHSWRATRLWHSNDVVTHLTSLEWWESSWITRGGFLGWLNRPWMSQWLPQYFKVRSLYTFNYSSTLWMRL